jgi:hypothetical protein
MSASITEIRIALRAHGFHPLPAEGKAVYMKGWSGKFDSNDQEVALWERMYPLAHNTGILCRYTPAIDIDITNPDAAEALEDLVRETFEERGYVLPRIGQAPKRLFFLRRDKPFPKLKLTLTGGEGAAEIEILSDGEQAIVHGIHSKTGQPYTWPRGVLWDIDAEQLPYVTREQVLAFLQAAAELLVRDFNYSNPQIDDASGTKTKTDRAADESKDQGGGNNWGFYEDNLIDHDILAAYAMALIRTGMHRGAVKSLLRAKIDRIDTKGGPELEARKQRRLNEISDMVDSAVKKLTAELGLPPKPEATEIGLVCAASVTMAKIDWLWTNHLARGKVTLFTGDTGQGKSQISVDATARLTKIGEWPDGETAPIGNAIILSSEDAINDTIVPRLELAGADLARVHLMSFVKTNGISRTFSLQNDLPQLGEKINQVGNVLLVIIDPITSYLGSRIDSHRTTDVRAALEPLATFGEQFNVSILAITHPTKAPQVKAIHATTGSGAFSAFPRLLFLAADDPDKKDRHLLLAVKNNIGRKAEGIGYRTEQQLVGPNKDILASRVVWDHQPVTLTADQVLERAAERRRGTATAEATEFLRQELGGGPRRAEDIKDKADALGISERTLYRARKKLGVEAVKTGYQGQWSVKLPGASRSWSEPPDVEPNDDNNESD